MKLICIPSKAKKYFCIPMYFRTFIHLHVMHFRFFHWSLSIQLTNFPMLKNRVQAFQENLRLVKERSNVGDPKELGPTNLIVKRRQPFTIQAYATPQFQHSLVIPLIALSIELVWSKKSQESSPCFDKSKNYEAPPKVKRINEEALP